MKTKSVKKALAFFLGILVTGFVFCVGSSQAQAADSDKDTIVMLSAGALQGSLDPAKHTILANVHLEWFIFDRLIEMDTVTMQAVPKLATEWAWIDDTTLQLKLRQGVKFHDGTDFDAEDAKYALERQSKESPWWKEPVNVEIVDKYTVNIRPSSGQRFAPLINTICITPIVSAGDDDAQLARKQNGTGPYKFMDYSSETVTCEANADYWDGAPKTKNFLFRYIADANTRLSALQNGEADIIERIDVEQVDLLKNAGFNVMQQVSNEQKYMVYKWRVQPIENNKLRLAISHAIDRETIVNDILDGYGVLADSFLSPVVWGYAPAEGFPTYDPAKAKALLAEAGYPDGKGLPTLTYFTSMGLYPKTKEYGEYIVANLNDIGIDVKFEPMETSVWEEKLYLPDSGSMCDTGWMPGGLEPDFWLRTLYYGPGRTSFCDDPDINAALDKEGSELDDEKRKAIIKDELMPVLAQKVPHLPLFASVMVCATAPDVKDFKLLPTGCFDVTKMYRE